MRSETNKTWMSRHKKPSSQLGRTAVHSSGRYEVLLLLNKWSWNGTHNLSSRLFDLICSQPNQQLAESQIQYLRTALVKKKTLSFLLNHKSQRKAAAPTRNNKLEYFPHYLYQFLKKIYNIWQGNTKHHRQRKPEKFSMFTLKKQMLGNLNITAEVTVFVFFINFF